MPCIKCGNKFRIGKGPCVYRSRESCEKALKAYYAKQKKKKKKASKKLGPNQPPPKYS